MSRRKSGPVTQPAESSPKNIVVFGESGVGKTSLINLIAGQSIAAPSSSAKGCTFRHKKYELQVDDTPYAIWETAGLDAADETLPVEIAEEKLERLLRDLTRANGVHLLVYCVRTTLLRRTLLANYNIFYSAICQKRIPIVVVVTRLEIYREQMEDWWGAYEWEFSALEMYFDGHACVTTLDADKVNSPIIKQRCHASRQAVLSLIASTCGRDHRGTGQDVWVSTALADVRATGMLGPTIVRALPPAESADTHVTVAELQRVIQPETHPLQPIDSDIVPIGCFGWLTNMRLRARLHSGSTYAVEDSGRLTVSKVWAPRHAR